MSSNTTIAKNTIFLYFRMILLLLVGLYTSRIVLQTLGVSDYGLYSVIGGLVAMIGFMHSTLSGATTRFLNVEMEKGNMESRKKLFSTIIFIHLGLCVILLILGETIGLWFLSNKMNIPEGRFIAAMVVYQVSIISVLFTVMQIPYDAAIIAHEKMNIYAYISLFDAFSKLFIVYIMNFLAFDKLISYSIFVLIVSIIGRMITQIYCRRNFEETHFKYFFAKKIFKEIMGYFGWDLFGNFSLMIKNQGTNILQNVFFGTRVNAAVSLDTTLYYTLNGFYSNFILALKPQIIKSYVSNNLNRMFELLYSGIRLSFYLLCLIVLPVYLDMDLFFSIWLKNVPYHLMEFFKITLIISLISSQNPLILLIIQASGNIKKINILNSIILLLAFIINFFLFKIGFKSIAAYYISLLVSIFYSIILLFSFKQNVKSFKIAIFLYKTTFTNWGIFLISFILTQLLFYFTKSFITIPFYKSFISVILLLFFIWTIGLSKNEKNLFLNFLLKKTK